MIAYAGGATTYVMWGDDVDWQTLPGRITQEFGYVPDLLKHEHVRETVSRLDYRLPILVPSTLDARFHQLIGSLNVSAYVHQRRKAVEGVQTLRFGHNSCVISEGLRLNGRRHRTTA